MKPARFYFHIYLTHSRIHIQVITCKHQHSNMYLQVSKFKYALTKSTCIYPHYNHIHTQIHTEPSNRKRKRRRQMRKTVWNKDCYGHLSLGLGLSELLLLCLNLGHVDAQSGLIHTVGILSAIGVRMTESVDSSEEERGRKRNSKLDLVCVCVTENLACLFVQCFSFVCIA